MKNSLTWKNIVGYGLGDVANNFAFAMGVMFLLKDSDSMAFDVPGFPHIPQVIITFRPFSSSHSSCPAPCRRSRHQNQ